MKKLLLIIFALLLFSGCEPTSQSKHEFSDGSTMYARRFKFDGHNYIEFIRPSLHTGYDNYTGYVHDPECPCQKHK